MLQFALASTGVTLIVWYGAVLGYALITRPRDLAAGPATMHLGVEPPAVVNLLITRGELTAAAVDATLLDLAARRILELHQPGRDPGDLLIRVRVAQPSGLSAYEQRVFDRCAAFAGARLVPLRQVAAHHVDGGPNWFMHLRAEVVHDAQARGLMRTRKMGSALVFGSLVAGMAIACAGILPLISPGHGALGSAIGTGAVLGWFVASPTIAAFLMCFAVLHFRAPRHTDLGRQTGSYWLGVAGWLAAHESLASLPPAAVAVWDRYLAYGVALGVNPVADAGLDLRVGHTSRFISRYTGTMRTIVIRYPRDPFAYTQAGVRALWSAVVLAAWAVFWWRGEPLTKSWPIWVRVAILAVAVAWTARTTYRFVRSSHAKLTPMTITGQVLAAHSWRPRADHTAGWVQIAIDDGVHSRTRPWLVRADRAAGIRPGDVVRIRAQRWTHYVLRLELLGVG